MLRHALCALVALSLSLNASGDQDEPAAKDDPKAKAETTPQPELLPAPRRVTHSLFNGDLYIIPNLPPQPGTREVWQYYAVDRSGRFVTRVILAPHESYYLHNGQVFPWTTTRPTLHMPYALD